jgi:hypothetical protein
MANSRQRTAGGARAHRADSRAACTYGPLWVRFNVNLCGCLHWGAYSLNIDPARFTANNTWIQVSTYSDSAYVRRWATILYSTVRVYQYHGTLCNVGAMYTDDIDTTVEITLSKDTGIWLVYWYGRRYLDASWFGSLRYRPLLFNGTGTTRAAIPNGQTVCPAVLTDTTGDGIIAAIGGAIEIRLSAPAEMAAALDSSVPSVAGVVQTADHSALDKLAICRKCPNYDPDRQGCRLLPAEPEGLACWIELRRRIEGGEPCPVGKWNGGPL